MTFKKLVCNVLFNKILYLGEKNYLIYRDGETKEVGTDYAGKIRLIVIGKKYYFETLKTFPFSNLKDIRSAIRTDITAFSPFETDIFLVRKTGQTGDSAKVNLWFINKVIAKTLDALSPMFIIPETALLSFRNADAASIYNIQTTDDQRLLVHIGLDGVVRSMISHRDKPDLNRFLRSISGDARDCLITDIAGMEDYLGFLQATLFDMPKRSLLCFKNPGAFSANISKKQLTVGLATAATLFFLYTGLSTLMPYVAMNRLYKEDQTLSSNLSGLLKKRDMVEIYHKKQKALAERINSYTYKVPLMNQLSNVLPEGTTISQLTVSGNMVEMRGTVSKASELLGALSQVKEIRNAQFTSPLRQDRKTGMEIFRLTFIYDPQITQIFAD